MDTRRIHKSKTFETRRKGGSGGVCLAGLLFAEPGFRGTEIAAKHCHAERRLELSFAMREQVEASRGRRSRDTATGSSYEAVPLGPLVALSYWVELPDAAWQRTMCRDLSTAPSLPLVVPPSLKMTDILRPSVFQRFSFAGNYALAPRFSSTASKLFFACALSRPLRKISLIKLMGSSAARWIKRAEGVSLLPSRAAFTSLR